MAMRKNTLIACGVVILGMLAAGSGYARTIGWSHANHLTFSGAVALPGVSLARGSYTFEQLEGSSGIVRVLSRDRSQVYFMGFTRQVARPAGMPADRMVTFAETPRGVPPHVDTWYPAGASSGHQFIYAAK